MRDDQEHQEDNYLPGLLERPEEVASDPANPRETPTAKPRGEDDERGCDREDTD